MSTQPDDADQPDQDEEYDAEPDGDDAEAGPAPSADLSGEEIP